jgi:hypothetical protein
MIAGRAGRAASSGAWAAIGKTLRAMSAAMEVVAALDGNRCKVILLRDLEYAMASDQLKFADCLSDDLVTTFKFHELH